MDSKYYFDAYQNYSKDVSRFLCKATQNIPNNEFYAGQLVLYDGTPCIIMSYPVNDMVVVMNAAYKVGDWYTTKVYVWELSSAKQKAVTGELCSCSSQAIFNQGCQCGGK